MYKFHPFTSNIADIQAYLRGLTGASAAMCPSCALSLALLLGKGESGLRTGRGARIATH